MPAVAFHFNALSTLPYAARLARKVLRLGQTLAFTAPAPILLELSAQLWKITPQDFLAHAIIGKSPEKTLSCSPIILAENVENIPARFSVLVNLNEHIPDNIAHFERIIEIVPQNPEHAKIAARTRWREYAARGWEIIKHDLNSPQNQNG